MLKIQFFSANSRAQNGSISGQRIVPQLHLQRFFRYQAAGASPTSTNRSFTKFLFKNLCFFYQFFYIFILKFHLDCADFWAWRDREPQLCRVYGNMVEPVLGFPTPPHWEELSTKLPEGPWSSRSPVSDPSYLPRGHHIYFSVSNFNSFLQTLKVIVPFFAFLTPHSFSITVSDFFFFFFFLVSIIITVLWISRSNKS